MICIDYKHVGKWAEDHRINYTTYSDWQVSLKFMI